MAIFEPLKADVAPRQAVEQPSAIGAVADLLKGSGFFSAPKEPRQPTKDEAYQGAWNSFLENQSRVLQPGDPGYGQWLRTTAPRFVAQNPQYATETKALLETQGVSFAVDESAAVEDAQSQARIDFLSSDIGRAADYNARIAATDENGLFNEGVYKAEVEKAYANNVMMNANLADLKRQAEGQTNAKTVADSYWNAGRGAAQQFVSAQVNAIGDLINDIKDGSAEVTPEMAATLGVAPGKVTTANFDVYLQKYRASLAQNTLAFTQQALLASGEVDPNLLMSNVPGKAYIDEILAPVDAILAVGNNFDSAAEVTKSMMDQDTQAIYSDLRKNDPALYAALVTTSVLPPELGSEVFRVFSETGTEGFSRAAKRFGVEITADLPTAEVVARIEDLPKAEAETQASAAAAVLSSGTAKDNVVKNSVVNLFSGNNRANSARPLGLETFQALSKNATSINLQTSSDPEFKNYFVDETVSDVNKTFKEFTAILKGDSTLKFAVDANGMVSIQPNSANIRGGFMAIATQTKIDSLMNSGVGKDFFGKLKELDKLGPVGAEIKKTFLDINGLSMADEQAAAATTEGTAGSGEIGQTLGIDFAGLEAQAGIPAGFLERTAYIESRGRVDAVSPTGATGLFQFTKGTAADYGLVDRNDPVQSTAAAVRLAVANQQTLRNNLGREPTGAELYLAHQQGAGGASALLANPNANVVDALLSVYRGNRAKAEQAVEVNGGNVNMTAGEFANIWISKYNGARGPISASQATGRPTPVDPSNAIAVAREEQALTLPSPAPTEAAPAAAPTEAATAELPTDFSNATTGVMPQQEEQTQAPVVDAEVQALIDNLSTKTKRQLKAAGIEPTSLKFFETDAAAEAAIESGELKEGDAYILPNGQVNIVEGD